MLLLAPGTYRPVNRSTTLLKPSPLILFSFSLLTSQNPIVPCRDELRRASIVVAASAAAHAQSFSQSAIERVAEKLRSLGYVEDDGNKVKPEETLYQKTNSSSPGEIFVPLPNQLPKYRVGHTLDPSWSTPQNPVPLPGSGNAIQRFHALRSEVKREQEEEREKNQNETKETVITKAELTLPGKELRRLRTLGIKLDQKINIGKSGITEGIVNGIHERWRRSELVKINCKELCRMNMKRTHDILEAKTGGLVIWRSGSTIVLYRGTDYKYPYFSGIETNSFSINGGSYPSLVKGVGSPNRVRYELPGEQKLVEEADQLLEGLGPRFTDWWGNLPLPIDADLLPDIVPGYKRPFRLLPYGVKPILTNDEMTTLKRLARPLRCHFALSWNRSLQGLAAAIVKLWEKCEIAKIAVKRGAQNTNSKLMAEELKHLTGGILLARDKDYITLYRGKDFLPAVVSIAIEERRKQTIRGNPRKCNSPVSDANHQAQPITESISNDESSCENLKTAAQEKQVLILREEAVQPIIQFPSEEENKGKSNQKDVPQKRQLYSVEAAAKRTSDKLEATLQKKAKAEKLLEELVMEEVSIQPITDKEGITEEERYMLRKVGLRMKPFLILGRRGVFSGTVENMHLHWKYRELVKILAGGRKGIEEVQQIAGTLESESGGILVAIEQTSKGYAIIVYRGKNYERPAFLRPQTLLSKRQAMKRSIEAQRRESLKLHVLKLNQNIEDLKLKLSKDRAMIDVQLRDLKTEKQELQQNVFTQSENKAEVEFNTSVVENCYTLPTKGIELVPNLNSESERFSKDQQVINEAHLCVSSPEEELQSDHSMLLENKDEVLTYTIESEHVSSKEIKSEPTLEADNVKYETASGPHSFKTSSSFHDRAEKRLDFDMKSAASFAVNSLKTKVEHGPEEKESQEVPFSASPLSNRERLILRKQALTTTKRPVLAVGKGDIFTGVAKAIKTHFKKHPLAVVNVKGRAIGTSVREVASELEQATGAMLVCHETNKVILYRGWGAAGIKATRTMSSGNATREQQKVQMAVSPELISAIRFECGLQLDHKEDASLKLLNSFGG
ncbi:unnamed protein product [Cuscuta europaea]|uniref:CRM domain-containing protein n=1 Tax=Cuscuta europaea TaxID=41803 RepID=A0A9P0Z2Y8_CUSEU|nr:unnamed protein product [Cuscuta europaea]